VAVAGLLAALLGGLPWWGWVLIIVVGLVAGAVWAVRRGRAAEAADAADDGAAEDSAADGSAANDGAAVDGSPPPAGPAA
jgi:hypothetical protein